jgi:DNA-binding NtrC family response regulator
MSNPTLLVIAPDTADRHLVVHTAMEAGFAVHVTDTGTEGLAAFRLRPADVVVANLDVPDADGLALVRTVCDEAPDTIVVIMTGQASVESAVEAIRLGVRDYLRTPIDPDLLRHLCDQKFDGALRRRVHRFPAERSAGVAFHGMIGRSAPMQELFRLLRIVAPHGQGALITGETGTGKELVARALHQLGPRADRRFVVINCSAVVETLFESELFGHVRGAFTGASESKAGLFELADGGTLFLDEVGELPSGVQAKLLRAIEYGEVLRVGSLEPRRVDVQILAATNRDLEIECEGGRFRRDLYYRLNVIDVRVPALRDRRDDIVLLASHFMREAAARLAKPLSGLTAGAERLLRDSPWPGNVRELRNVIERACLLAEGRLLGDADIRRSLPPARPWAQPAPAHERTSPAVTSGPSYIVPPAAPPDAPQAFGRDVEPLSDVERDAIVRALQRARGNKKVAASLLGVSRRALYRRLERLQLGDTIVRRGQGAA